MTDPETVLWAQIRAAETRLELARQELDRGAGPSRLPLVESAIENETDTLTELRGQLAELTGDRR
ncbi:hypothetical protein [Cellulomonas sp. Y8]|uniref:hypothetical protein n=1 Tax=Cellulomonas sp. Y8 TaxID=2591145 RepID=UPI003D7473A9